jgi:ABC-type cobalamin/Fe3+-siderophores transport system ATPase subunit
MTAPPTPATPAGGGAPPTGSSVPAELRASKLTLGYEKRIVVRDLDLSFPIGRVTAVVGPNGSGKSTIVRATARLLRPRSGVVLLDGKAIARMPTKEVARRLAVLPQGPSSPEGLTVERLVWNGRYPHQGFLGTSSAGDAEAVQWALRETHLEAFADRPLDALSGGERQRAWIAMALAQQTPILLLDEPTTFLDLGHQLEVLELLGELNRNQGMTVVMVLHELNQAARYSDHMVAVHEGSIWREGTPSEVLTPELLNEVFGVHATVVVDPGSGRPYCLPTSRASSETAPRPD